MSVCTLLPVSHEECVYLLVAGTFSDAVTPSERAQSDDLGRQRAVSVKQAMAFVYQQYKDRAWGADSMSPLFGQPNNDWAGTAPALVPQCVSRTMERMGWGGVLELYPALAHLHCDFPLSTDDP